MNNTMAQLGLKQLQINPARYSTYGNGLGSGTSSLCSNSYSQPGPVPGGYGPTTGNT